MMGGLHLFQRLATTTATLTLLLLASASASTHSFTQLGRRAARGPDWKVTIRSSVSTVVQRREMRAVGPGSSPPTCRSKCGNCSPCKPVHVPIHSSLNLPYEYYPEAWRCKCGDKLFMP